MLVGFAPGPAAQERELEHLIELYAQHLDGRCQLKNKSDTTFLAELGEAVKIMPLHTPDTPRSSHAQTYTATYTCACTSTCGTRGPCLTVRWPTLA
eukprot:scaffold87958_cov66-Phaeocystis_antarctica.AAC.1